MELPLWAWWILAALNLLTLVVAVFDKVRARRGGPRVRERTLLALALLGGSIGLLLAMVLARHKVRKRSFLAKLLAVLSLQFLVFLAVVYVS